MQTAIQTMTPAALADLRDAGADAAARLYLRFTLNDEAFAIDIQQIREIIEYGQVTQVPMMPTTVRGVINLRGAVVPVLDLSARFGRARTDVARRTCIVIVEVPPVVEGERPQVLGIVVDAVNEVLEIPAADIEPPPSFGTRLRSNFVAGMGRVAGRFVIILDLPRALALDELARLAALAAPAEAARTAGQD
jgi:purine-binding chemotaxis protein CheW